MSTNKALEFLNNTKNTEIRFTPDLRNQLNANLYELSANQIPKEYKRIVKDHLSMVLLLENCLAEHAKGLDRLWEELDNELVESEQYD
jgi:hypothetical protein